MPRFFPTFTARARRRALRAVAACAALGGVGCMSLDVTNADTPNVEDVFANGVNLENTVGLSFRTLYGVTMGSRTNSSWPVVPIGALAELITTDLAIAWELIQEPRVPFNNVDPGQWTNRKPWYDLYEVIATATDALRALDRGVRVGVVNAASPSGADTPRARVWSRFMLGASQVYLGIYFDKAFATDETSDLSFLQGEIQPGQFPLEFTPYRAMAAFGVRQLEQAVAEARRAPTNFTLPLEWVNQQTINRDELVRILNGYIVRGLVYWARTPQERAQVDWNKVLELTAPGNVITRDFSVLADVTKSGTVSTWLQYTQLQTDARADNMLIGPSDTSGTYQRWLQTPFEQRTEIQVRTPDRRIHGAGGPNTNGKYFGQPTDARGTYVQTMRTGRGTTIFSRYRGIRYGTQHFQIGQIPVMSPVEMDLLRAEAFLRLGRPADAVPLINRTRVANGELPPVTVNGTGSLPACVPRKDDGSCGDLMDAMLYEKRIELQSVEPILHWADWRAFGKLQRGSMMQFPIHGRELQVLGLPIYTFGGSNPGSAP